MNNNIKIYNYIVLYNNNVITHADARHYSKEALLEELRRIYHEPCIIEIKEGFKGGLFNASPRF